LGCRKESEMWGKGKGGEEGREQKAGSRKQERLVGP
jgi:hypothetical protein